MKCNICDFEIKNIFINNVDISVSSDGKIIKNKLQIYECKKCTHLQKLPFKYLDKIYEKYKSNDLINGVDQVKFIGKVPRLRTDIIINKIQYYLKDKRTILDVGTGTGVFLKSCENIKNLELYAFDINEDNKEKVLKINNLKNFYSINLESIDNSFDIISLIHVLEHIRDPRSFLLILKSKLNKDGILLIQVPYILENSNDFLIVDHLSHFKKNTILNLLKNFFSSVTFINTSIKNELTIIASDNCSIPKWDYSEESKLINPLYLHKINDFLSFNEDSFFIFGTAPISIYYASIMHRNNKLLGFLDEDNLKVGKKHFNILIMHPKNIKDIFCFIPLNEDIVESLRLKYKRIKFISIKEILKYE